MEQIQKTRPMAYKLFSRSAVDIIIPFHSQYEKVSELIKSILYSVRSNPYQIILVDDCSENKNFGEEIKNQFLKTTPQGCKPQVKYVRSDVRLGFGGALNLGYESGSSPWTLFMHSDCLVEDPNFMINMGTSLLNWKRQGVPVKMVSARSDNPGDCELAKASKGDKEEKDIILENQSLPLFCAMCNRDLFNHIRGFIKSYPYAWYEDEELSHRMKKFGFLQGISTKSWIKHYGSLTINYVWDHDPKSKEIMENNRNLCVADIKRLS